MKIIVDAMGSDHRPEPDVAGAVAAAREYGVKIALVGPEARLRQELQRAGGVDLGIEIINATQEIQMQEHPALAVKEKKDSSIVVGMQQLKQGNADAFVSMGNTGAVLTAAVLYVQRIRGIIRPALATVYPTPLGPLLLLDIGANTDCKPEWLEQFAWMGSLYAERVLNLPHPRVALLANGEEETKGNQLVQDAHARLKARGDLNFIGNIEGKDIPMRSADVVVTDGFDGNIVIKLSEGIGKMLIELIETQIKGNPITMIGGGLSYPAFKKVKKIMDYSEYGGGPLLGVNGVVIIGHGRSNANAVKNAIRVAKQAVESKMIDTIRASLNR
ncbi:MAG: phosphate acyltransferase PlsX [Anaerolineae bacterium]